MVERRNHQFLDRISTQMVAFEEENRVERLICDFEKFKSNSIWKF